MTLVRVLITHLDMVFLFNIYTLDLRGRIRRGLPLGLSEAKLMGLLAEGAQNYC